MPDRLLSDRLRVLVVDDDEDDFLIARDLLGDSEEATFTTVHIPDPRQALARLEEEQPDAILMDYRLGELDGLTVLEQALALGFDGPIIMLTGQHERELAQQALRRGAADYLVKGDLDTDGLVRSIRYSIERKRLENHLRTLNADLESRVQKRTEDLQGFTYSVSHDLRAPLRTLSTFSQILLEDYGDILPEEARELLHRQSSAAVRLGQLMDDLLAFSRLGSVPLETRAVDMTELFRQAGQDAQALHPERHLRLEVPDGMTARGDARLLRLTVANLLENAIKFAKPEGEACVRVVEKKEDGQRRYAVSDTGMGLDPKFADRIWKPFERLVHTEQVQGTGIGLANVRRIIERHGGTTRATGQIGVGATVEFTLPAP